MLVGSWRSARWTERLVACWVESLGGEGLGFCQLLLFLGWFRVVGNLRVVISCPCGGFASGECCVCCCDLAGVEDHYDDGDQLYCGDCVRNLKNF